MYNLDEYKLQLKYMFRSVLRENLFCDTKKRVLLNNENLTDLEMQRVCNQQLLNSLISAKKNIPKYKGCKIPYQLSNIEEYVRTEFPIINKETLIENAQFYPSPSLRHLVRFEGKTSGTSGMPLKIYRDFNSILWENAFLLRHWDWCGYKRGMPRCLLRGDEVVPIQRKSPPFWIFNRTDNQLILSSRHLSESTADLFVGEIEKLQPYLLQAYPSTVFELAQYLDRRNISLNIPFVFTSSEVLYPYQRLLISKVFNCRVMDLYGMAERVALATECEHGNLHVNTDYSFVEIVDNDGNPTDDFGQVVGTSYHNHLMPLIRYQISDMAKWRKGICACGRRYPMIESIEGRVGDTIFDVDGKPISQALITFAFSSLSNIKCTQVAQISNDLIEIRVVPFANASPDLALSVVANFKEKVCSNVSIKVKICDDIPRTKSVKFKWIVNECGRSYVQN